MKGEKKLMESLRVLALDGLHVPAIISKAEALASLGEFTLAVDTYELVLGLLDDDDDEHQKCEAQLAECKRLSEECATGKIDVTAFKFELEAVLVNKKDEQLGFPVVNCNGLCISFMDLPMAVADFVGPLEIDGKRLVLSEAVERGDLLFVSNALARVSSSMAELHAAIKSQAFASSRVSRILCFLAGLADELKIDDFRLNRGTTMFEEMDDDKLAMALEGHYHNFDQWVVCKKARPSGRGDGKYYRTAVFQGDDEGNDALKWRGFWTLLCFLKHSCDPNVALTFVGGVAIARATKRLVAGMELLCCNPDVNPLGSRSARHLGLEHRNFVPFAVPKVCGCHRCATELPIQIPMLMLDICILREDERQCALASSTEEWLNLRPTHKSGVRIPSVQAMVQAIHDYAMGGYESGVVFQKLLHIASFALPEEKETVEALVSQAVFSWYGPHLSTDMERKLREFARRYF